MSNAMSPSGHSFADLSMHEAVSVKGHPGSGSASSPAARGIGPVSGLIDLVWDLVDRHVENGKAATQGTRGGGSAGGSDDEAGDGFLSLSTGSDDDSPLKAVTRAGGSAASDDGGQQGGSGNHGGQSNGGASASGKVTADASSTNVAVGPAGPSSTTGHGQSAVPAELESVLQMLAVMMGSPGTSQRDKAKVMEFFKELLKMADKTDPELAQGIRSTLDGSLEGLRNGHDMAAADTAELEAILDNGSTASSNDADEEPASSSVTG